MDRIETAKLLKLIEMSYPGFTIDEEKINWWSENLQDVSFDKARANLKRHIRKSLFAPKIVEIMSIESSLYRDLTNYEPGGE